VRQERRGRGPAPAGQVAPEAARVAEVVVQLVRRVEAGEVVGETDQAHRRFVGQVAVAPLLVLLQEPADLAVILGPAAVDRAPDGRPGRALSGVFRVGEHDAGPAVLDGVRLGERAVPPHVVDRVDELQLAVDQEGVSRVDALGHALGVEANRAGKRRGLPTAELLLDLLAAEPLGARGDAGHAAVAGAVGLHRAALAVDGRELAPDRGVDGQPLLAPERLGYFMALRAALGQGRPGRRLGACDRGALLDGPPERAGQHVVERDVVHQQLDLRRQVEPQLGLIAPRGGGVEVDLRHAVELVAVAGPDEILGGLPGGAVAHLHRHQQRQAEWAELLGRHGADHANGVEPRVEPAQVELQNRAARAQTYHRHGRGVLAGRPRLVVARDRVDGLGVLLDL